LFSSLHKVVRGIGKSCLTVELEVGEDAGGYCRSSGGGINEKKAALGQICWKELRIVWPGRGSLLDGMMHTTDFFLLLFSCV